MTGDLAQQASHTTKAAPENNAALFERPTLPLEAVVSVLDARHHDRMLALWDELQQEFGVAGVFESPIPHFSYHVAAAYDIEALSEILHTCAREWAPLQVQTAGLGLFTGPQPVLYIPIVRNAPLSALQAALSQRLRPVARRPLAYYLPEHWLPHITLTLGDVGSAVLAAIITYLCPHNFRWDISINNLAIICDNCGVRGLGAQFTLTGSGGDGVMG